MSVVNESEVRSSFPARISLPSGSHLLPTSLPFPRGGSGGATSSGGYPAATTAGSHPDAPDYGSSAESPAFIHKQMQFLEQAGHSQLLLSGLYPGAPITDAQVIH